MDRFTKEDLRTLFSDGNGLKVSIFMPTHRVAADAPQDRIVLKNLRREAAQELERNGLRKPDIRQFLSLIDGLTRRTAFWLHQSDGLALFRSSDLFRYYRLSIPFEPDVAVSRRFHIKPLLPLLAGEEKFYILALSQKEVRLLEGTPFTTSEVKVERFPGGLLEALNYDQPERQLVQFHTRTRQAAPGGGRPPSIFRGHGVGMDDKKEDIRQYFQIIDRDIRKALREEEAPLILAGVEYLFPIYREVNTYRNVYEAGVKGNPDGLSDAELHREAWAVIKPYFDQRREEQVARYREKLGTGLSSNLVEEVVPAAHRGRIDTLFVAPGAELWGDFDPQNNALHLATGKGNGEEDLLEYAAVQTYLNGGKVYAAKDPGVLDGTPMAAVFRY